MQDARINRRQFFDVLVGAAAICAGSSTIDGAQSGARRLLQLSGYPLDLETPLEKLASSFDAQRSMHAYAAVDRALAALDRNASPKVVADWLLLEL